MRKNEQPTNYEDEEDDTDKDTKATDTPTNRASTTSNVSAGGDTLPTTDKASSLAGQGIESEGIRKREVTSSTEEVQ